MSNIKNHATHSADLQILENYYGDESDRNARTSRSASPAVADKPDGCIPSKNKDYAFQPLSPETKTKIRSTFYEAPRSNADQRGKFSTNLDRNLSIVQHILDTREAEYCDFLNLKIFCGTYNVNGQFPTEKLSPWLASSTHVPVPPDIYAVGFQELDLSQQAFLFDNTQREHEWADRVKSSLHPAGNYAELKRVRLIGMFLLVYVQKKLLAHINNNSIDTVTVGTGLLNRMGNKGGVAIRFKLYDTTICFVNSHLAAGNDELQRRNQDYREISKIRFFQYNASHVVQGPIGIFDHDLVFWIGDLNYRLQHFDAMVLLEIAEVKRCCDTGKFEDLVKYDQLGQMQEQNMAFQEFQEGPLTFVPTYKYDPGTDIWDSSEKCRVPAWCDRILWIGERVHELAAYKSVPELRISDHKPVLAVFTVQAKRIDEKRYAKFYESALREADRLENEWLPMVSIDKSDFKCPNVKFFEPHVQTLTVTNTGQVPVQISFTPKNNDEAYCKRWLQVTPSNHVIKVGAECVLDIQILVDKETAWALNAGLDCLEDILVLHLEKGKDYFLTVSGTYVPSCFGQSLEYLVGLTHPIRDVPVAQLVDIGPDMNNSLLPPAVQLPVPKELWRLVDHLVKHGLNEPDLFGQAGSQAECNVIRDMLDTGATSTLPGSIHSVVETLLRFLESLREPVIPARFTERCLNHCHDWSMCKQIINELTPLCHKNVFVYLVKFLKEVLKHSSANGTSTDAIAMLFAPEIIRVNQRSTTSKSANESAASALSVRGRQQQKTHAVVTFLTQFLTHDCQDL